MYFVKIAFLGWSEWSSWSICNEDGEKIRYRKCLTKNPGPKECLGEEKQTKICKSVLSTNGKIKHIDLQGEHIVFNFTVLLF